ncbi:ATP-binding protein [Streptomyces sp. NBC_00513]|uniref:ATP-binding protein n=1 Tax=unclassified Streptomyces TaxID=2593676 RepID=UPI0022533E11|nr:ATP-binding protein [Streptomyces sp. NBC_00424]MCX5078694.1 ATP-binding protein [Streptomyces sp. NBC_00424]WUD39137.1 ATP-binding protein [Streptomyces sp. NBC_00513]
MPLPASFTPTADRFITAYDCRLPCDDRAPAELRAWVGAHLNKYQSRLLGDDLAVVASELATNAIRHGGVPVWVALMLAEDSSKAVHARLEVADSGPGFTPGCNSRGLDDYPSLECDGRGLRIVAELARRWGVERSHGKHIVWAELGGVSP